jgi:hypothetical protein
MMLHLQNRRLENRPRPHRGGCPKRGVSIIFSLKNIGEKRIFVSYDIPSSVNKEAFVNKFHIPNTKTSLSFRFANVILRAKSNWVRGIFSLHTSPPKVSDHRVYFSNESFRENNSGHVINMN